MQEGYYTSGEFAKKANVTVRTVRFYDKQGILKPSKTGENGYRLYTDEDFGRLQRILSLRYLGFSLDEIAAMPMGDDAEDVARSLAMQRKLIQKRIRHLESMDQALTDTERMVGDTRQVDWSRILHLIHITNMEHAVVEQYKSAVNIDVRIDLHRRFSRNPVGWFAWLASQIDFAAARDILEVGCGNGELWQNVSPGIIASRRIHVTDVSEGMVEDAAARLHSIVPASGFAHDPAAGAPVSDAAAEPKSGKEASPAPSPAGARTPASGGMPGLQFRVEDCQRLSYGDASFDAVIANHVLFYVKDIPQALREIRRVLRSGGVFYCSTYGRTHMKEITDLVREFDPRINLSEVALYELFGLENGQAMLGQVFGRVEQILYDDYLLVDEAEPLLDYILSCHGNQGEYLNQRKDEFRRFLEGKIREKGGIRITKMAGIFVCRE